MSVVQGAHLVAGQWIDIDPTAAPDAGQAAIPKVLALVADACRAAEDAFVAYGQTTRTCRADFLEAIAHALDTRADAITSIAGHETALPAARLHGELGRTTGQIRMFARHIRDGAYLDRRHDPARPDRTPLPRPDLRLIQRPAGPVAVFGASNFPLAFSTAGGDTISALAAGCSVVVKGHPAHPGTTRIVAQAVDAAIRGCGLHPGVFGVIQCGSRAAGEALVQHPAIRAVGFTGSLAGGRALFDLCARRPDPIPVFGELGSTNPIFVLPAALAARGAAIAVGWCASVIQGAGQFCTKPGLIVVVDGPGLEAFVAATIGAIAPVQPQSMLTDAMAAAYRAGRDHLAHIPGVQALVTGPSVQRDAAPCVLQVSGSDWLDSPALSQEVFGPLGLIVRARDVDQMHAIARSLQGQLTCALHLDQADTTLARRLMPVLERKAGRILANGYPTGVEVSDAMVHGGPYPASTNFGATSVGALSIRRWLRPVCYQDMPEALLPVDLRLP